MDIGNTIRSLRKAKQMNQDEFASKIHISQTALSQIENGRTYPSKKTMLNICEVFGISEPFLYMLAVEKEDIPSGKVKLYNELFPTLKEFALELIGSK